MLTTPPPPLPDQTPSGLFVVPPQAARCPVQAKPGPPSRFGKGAQGVRSHPALPLTLGDNAHPQCFYFAQHAAEERIGL